MRRGVLTGLRIEHRLRPKSLLGKGGPVALGAPLIWGRGLQPRGASRNGLLGLQTRSDRENLLEKLGASCWGFDVQSATVVCGYWLRRLAVRVFFAILQVVTVEEAATNGRVSTGTCSKVERLGQ